MDLGGVIFLMGYIISSLLCFHIVEKMYLLGSKITYSSDFFVDSIQRKMANGWHTSSWEELWVGGPSLGVLFPSLFSISS